MIISLIAAMDRNRLIGSDNGMPWHLPADLSHFRKMTVNKPVVMGRKTLQSIGKALPKRTNIVMTRQSEFTFEGCRVATNVDGAIDLAGPCDELMVIGGGSIYEQFLPRAHRLYLTRIDESFEGDTYFPRFDTNQWVETAVSSHEADPKNPFSYAFITLERR